MQEHWWMIAERGGDVRRALMAETEHDRLVAEVKRNAAAERAVRKTLRAYPLPFTGTLPGVSPARLVFADSLRAVASGLRSIAAILDGNGRSATARHAAPAR